MKRFKGKTWVCVGTLALMGLTFSGCNNLFNNYTPTQLRQNASGIYTFSFAAKFDATNVVEDSVEAQIVIDGDTYQMQKASDEPLIFTYDFKVQPGESEVKYYYILKYDYINSGIRKTTIKDSFNETGDLFYANLTNRYASELVSNRGPVGSRIALIGRGFSAGDTVVIGGQEAQTTVNTPRDIEFVVPPLQPGRTYNVTVRTADSELDAGTFRVDAAQLQVQPQNLSLYAGEIKLMVVEVGGEAPAGGLTIDAMTDIPDSVIMPEIVIPEGARSVNVNVEGGDSGTGIIELSAPGYNTVTVPVEVQE
ncbi:MAG: hypothetical protein E1N59_2203 [Puniceicoccaceae bacterium 5H]|nr:MAG: hypothetical protein E1N59_2203 [Puniceicoccaceae bacterium 5H]